MSVQRPSQLDAGARIDILFRNTIVRYLFALAATGCAFALRVSLIPLTGTGAPFLLFFPAILVTSVFAGVAPGICALLLSLLLGTYTFVAHAGYPLFQATFQALLFSIDGALIIYLTFLMRKGRQEAEDANRKLSDANEETKRSMARTRAVLELAPDGFFQADLEARLTDVNQAACRLLGYSREELIGKTIFDITPVEDTGRLMAIRADLLVPGRVNISDWTKRRKDGTLVPVEVSSNILPDGRWQAFVRDISERKRVERTLQESEERFRLTIDEAPIGMALVALDGRFVRVNRALCEILGYSAAELTGLTFQAITHPDDRDTGRAAAGQLVRGEITRYHHERRYVGKDGTIVDVMLSASVLRDREGTPLYFISQMEDIRERKRAETALKESEQRLNLALDSAQIGMWDLNLVTDTAVRSLRHDQIFGYTSAVPTWGVAKFMTHVLPEDRDLARQAFDRAFASGNFDMECRIRWADTSIHWISAKGRVYRSPSGDPVRMMGTVMDVTERKRIEEALKAANASLDAIIENIPLMLFIKESQSLRFSRCNRAGEDLLGWPEETLIGKSDYDLWPREQADFFVEKDREALGSGAIVDIPEEPIQTRHQGVRLLHTKKVPIFDKAGHPIYLLGISEDITERRRIEKEQQLLADVGVVLSNSLDYEVTLATVARLVVENVADWCAVDVVEEQGQLRRMKVASADPGKAPLCTVLEHMPPNRDLPHLMRSVIESKRPVIVSHVTPEYVKSLAQGPEHLQALLATGVVSFVAVPLLLWEQPLGAIFLGSSNPARIYGQGDLRLAEALADRAAIAVENSRLYRASLHAAQLRDQVLGVVAHDLRNPLTTILLQAAALERRGYEPERRSMKPAETIYRAATRMNRLIQDLLDVALMESGQLTLERAPLSARELIAGAIEMQRPLASSSSLELRLDMDRDPPDVWGDRHRLSQVFENLIGNAIKFTKPGGRVTVSAAPKEHEVVFRVADTGSGIASEHLPHVFDRFWQATMAGRFGAGLGLAIAKGIVEAHGGRIWVESSEGRGTTLFFTVPTAPPDRDLSASDSH